MDEQTRGGCRGLDGDGASGAALLPVGPTCDRSASVPNDSVPDVSVPDHSIPKATAPSPVTSRAAVAKVLSRFKPGTRQARQVAMRTTSAAACTESRVLIDGAAERVSSSDRACETHREQISKSRDTIAQTRALIRRLAKLRER